MIKFVAIDILKGRAVRLLKGDYNTVTDYGDPVERAKLWSSLGAKYLHIVDLDGAKTGTGSNLDTIARITRETGVRVQTGGGIRTMTDIRERISVGIQRVILGTVCCTNPELVKEAVEEFGAERIVCGIDAKDGYVATQGWVESSLADPVTLGQSMYKMGVRYTVYTDISRDGMLSGVNVEASRIMQDRTKLKVIASGGVKDNDDITALIDAGLYGAILGKALYEGKVNI